MSLRTCIERFQGFVLYNGTYQADWPGFRNGEGGTVNRKTRRRPYQVDSWRLDEYGIAGSTHGTIDLSSRSSNHRLIPIQSYWNLEKSIFDLKPASLPSPDFDVSSIASDQSSKISFPLPADHLLHLIYYNVFRALYSNKSLLGLLAIYFLPGAGHATALHSDSVFPGYSAIRPAAPNIPICLSPTQLQMSLVHSTWINLLPFPKMRENLIKWESHFDHSEFVRDVVSNLVDDKKFSMQWSFHTPAISSRLVLTQGDDDAFTATRTGLIVWGEPYKAESWEATPGFLRKWAWAVEGCEELIESSNSWRMARGEDPMQLSMEPVEYQRLPDPP